MAYDISIQEKNTYVRVEVSGERTKDHEVQDSIDVWTRVTETCHQKGIFLILAVFNLTGELPILAAFDIGKLGAKLSSFKGLKVAIVDLNEKSREINLFSETVAVNRSFNNRSKLFADENKAIEWLLG